MTLPDAVAAWPWLPQLGLGVALRFDGVAVGAAACVAAGTLSAILARRRGARDGSPAGRPGGVLLLAAATLGAAVADDLALLWACLEISALAALWLQYEDGGGARRRSSALALYAVSEAGGLALLVAALLIADVSGSFRLGAAWHSSGDLRGHGLRLLMTGLAFAAAASRLAPCFVAGSRPAAWPARGAGIAAAVLLALRLGPALDTTRVALAGLAALGACAAALAGWRAARRAGSAPAADAPSLLTETALAARRLWQPLAAPSLPLSLAALVAGTALAVALGMGGARPGAWPKLASPAWSTLIGSGWSLLAIAGALCRERLPKLACALVWSAAVVLLLLVAAVPLVIAGAAIAAALPALWLLARARAVPLPSRRVLALLGTAVAAVALLRVPLARSGGLVRDGAAAGAAGFQILAALALPLAAAAALWALRRAAASVRQALAGIALLANLALAAGLLALADRGAPLGVALGIGPTPFGIHLLLDRLAAELLLLAALLALLAFLHGLTNLAARRAANADVTAQLGLFGAAGAVLAADLAEFALFFGILLLATQAALAASERGRTSAAASHVAVVGAAGTALLLLAAGAIYAALGTLDYAELARRVPQVAAGDAPLLRIGAYLLLIVLALRAGALPFGWWLSVATEAAPAAAMAGVIVTALIGVYALLRLYALVFPCFGAGPCGPSGLVMPIALATVAAGGIAALAAAGVRAMAAPLLFIGVGTLLVGVGSFRVAGFAATLFALAPTALGALALAFVGDRRRTGPLGLVALAAALGLPPFPGWVGRIAVLEATGADALVVWTLLLSAALLAALAAARAAAEKPPAPAAPAGQDAAAAVALALLAAFTLASGPAFDLASRTARQLLDRQALVGASPRATAAAAVP